MKNKVLYQDFLFDEIKYLNDMPNVKLAYCNKIDKLTALESLEYDNAIIEEGITIQLTTLMNMLKNDLWSALRQMLKKLKKVVIIDDIPLKNKELKQFKEFYLKTYYFIIKTCCENSFVFQIR